VASGKDDCCPGFHAALARCRQPGAVLVAARLDRTTRRAHTLSRLLEEGAAIRAADMPGAEELMLRIHAAMAQKERELISTRTKAALTAAKARGAVLGGTRVRGRRRGQIRVEPAWPSRKRRSEQFTGWHSSWSGCKLRE
jgi:DNA invertase Pin-like site-specific DNA recombinase